MGANWFRHTPAGLDHSIRDLLCPVFTAGWPDAFGRLLLRSYKSGGGTQNAARLDLFSRSARDRDSPQPRRKRYMTGDTVTNNAVLSEQAKDTRPNLRLGKMMKRY